MKRLFTVVVLFASIALFTLGDSTAAQEAPELPEPEKPNIVFILTDDQAFSDLAKMPKTKTLLVGQGVTYNRAYVTLSVCCPSRATYLTGQYAHNHGVTSNFNTHGAEKTFRESGADKDTLPVWLDRAGYTTAHIGKYMNGYGVPATTHVPPGWDYWNTYHGNFHLDPVLNDNGRLNEYPEGTVLDRVASRKAQFYIRNAQGPLYLQVSTHSPHGPLQYPKKYADLYKKAQAPRYPSYNERDVSDKPKWVRDANLFSKAKQRAIDNIYRDRLRSLRVVDDLVGDVVKTLREEGKLSNTYIVFSSDNGWHYGEHRIAAGKWTPYEEAMRVPVVVRGPGVAKGKVNSGFVLNNDFAPTFAELAGASTPDFVDGRSFTPLFGGGAVVPGWRTAFLYESYHYPEDLLPSPAPTYQGVRTEQSSLTEYATGEREIYDHQRDPYQLMNLWPGPETERRTLSERLEALKDCSAEECRSAEGN